MDTRALMTVDQYLHTAFEEADCDYVDGEVIERNVGELPHATVQLELAVRLKALPYGLQVRPEIRIQVSPTRFRVADIAVWRPGPIGTRIPTVPPFLVVEILSPEDRMVRMQPKIQDYLAHGVESVVVIDPEERRALRYSPAQPGGVLVDEIHTDDPAIHISLTELLSVLP
jgi:Uma2 family endonuclease